MGHALSVVAGLLVAAGAALTTVGALGWRRRLPRNRFAGVRTVSSLRDDETFAVANQVGAPLTVAAGAVAGLGGLAALAGPGGAAALRLTLVVLATVGALVLTVVGGVLGDRAARRVPARTFGGCAGACGSCCCAGSDQPASTESRASAGEPADTAPASGADQASEVKRG